MVNPVPGKAITTPYGKRGPHWSCSRDAHGNGIHTGVDYAAPSGAKVVAARPGTVNHVNHGSAFGSHQIDVLCSDGTRDFYAHMRSRVADGTKVQAGDKVGEVGAEGNVTGAHLHFERHATHTAGWSCGVVRDPAPSINWQPSGGDDDMAHYDHGSTGKARTLNPETWVQVEWDGVSGEGAFTKGESYIGFEGSRSYSAVLHITVEAPQGATIRMRTSEHWSGERLETNQQTEMLATGGNTYATHAQNGHVPEDRNLKFEVACSQPATLLAADAVILSW